MAASCEKLDQLVKDYLLFRGFSSTLKTLDAELKTDKDKGLRVDRMMEQIWTLLSGYDLQGLRDYWRYLNLRLFSRLEQRYAPSVRKLESGLLKLYVVHAHQTGKQDKVLAFFEQMGPDLQSHPDFREWFAFPFVANPSDNPTFSLYFNKQWQDTLQLSLHNFLSVVLQAMPVPTLLNVEFDARRMKTLLEENTSLKKQIMNASIPLDKAHSSKSATRRFLHTDIEQPISPPDMVYDFSGLSNESETPPQEKQKTTRRFPLSLTSPLVGRKKSEPSQSKTKTTAAPATTTSTGVLGKPASGRRSASISGQSSSVVPSSTTNVSGASPRHQATSVNKLTGATAQPQQSSTQVHKHPASTSDLPSATIASHSVNRSLSTPDRRSAVKKKTPPIIKQGSEPQPGSSVVLGSSADSDTHSSLGAEADSPFLLLEDEYIEHSSAASICYFSQTGQYVASLDVDGIVKVWTWSPQPATTATVMSKSAFLSLAWASKSDRWLLLGNKTGTIRLFDVKESKTYREVLVNPDNPANCMRVTDLSTNPNSMQFVCATSNLCPFTSDQSTVNGRLLQWDLRTLKLERALLVDSAKCNAVTSSSYCQSSPLLLTGGADGCLRLYDASQQKPVMKWEGHDAPIHTVQFNGDKSVYSMSADGKLCEWSLARAGQLLNSLSCGQRDLTKVATNGSCKGRLFSLDQGAHYLLTYAGKRGTIYKISGVPKPTPVMELKSHPLPVVTVDWSPSQDTRVCLTGSDDGKIKISTLLSK